jgi:DNA-directed RNA polymerase sigma subunit (sigma70/sigma32)
MFFGFDCPTAYTLKEIADRVGASRERVRQIKAEALGKLRKTPGFRGMAVPSAVAPWLREAA